MVDKRVKISLSKEAQRLLDNMKKRMNPKVRWKWLSEFVSNEIVKQFYKKTREELELECIKFEASKLNEEKREINAKLAYLSEKARGLREKVKEKKK